MTKETKNDTRYIFKAEKLGLDEYNYILNKMGYLTSNWDKAKRFKSKEKAGKALSKSRVIYGSVFEKAYLIKCVPPSNGGSDYTEQQSIAESTKEDNIKYQCFVRLENANGLATSKYIVNDKRERETIGHAGAKIFKSKNKATKALQRIRNRTGILFAGAEVIESYVPIEYRVSIEKEPKPQYLVLLEKRLHTMGFTSNHYIIKGNRDGETIFYMEAKKFKSKKRATKALRKIRNRTGILFKDAEIVEYHKPSDGEYETTEDETVETETKSKPSKKRYLAVLGARDGDIDILIKSGNEWGVTICYYKAKIFKSKKKAIKAIQAAREYYSMPYPNAWVDSYVTSDDNEGEATDNQYLSDKERKLWDFL